MAVRARATTAVWRFAAGKAWLVAVAVLVVGVFGLAGCGDDDPEVQRGVPVSQVLEDPGRFVGKEITVTGRVDVLTDRALTLGDNDLMVFAADRAEPNLERSGYGINDTVHATGTLQVMDYQALVNRLPHVSLGPSQFQNFERQPLLLARNVVPAS